MCFLLAIVALATTLGAGPPAAFAQDRQLARVVGLRPDGAEVGEPPPAAEVTRSQEVDLHAVPPILDPRYRHRKSGQLDLQLFGGRLVGSSIGDGYLIGGRLQFWFVRMLAVGVTIGRGAMGSDHDFGEIGDTSITAVLGHLELSNNAALKLGPNILEVDLFGRLGGGTWRLLEKWRPAGLIGGGIRIYFGLSWFAFRIDVTNHIHESPRPGGDQIDTDTLFAGTLVFFVPPDPSPYER